MDPGGCSTTIQLPALPSEATSAICADKHESKLAGLVVELEISLRHIEPRIWRNFVVPGGIKLNRLHKVIQVVMGWTNSHLHSFRSGNCEYVQPDPNDPNWQTSGSRFVHDERKHTLGDLIGAKGDVFMYHYDFWRRLEA